MWDEDFLELDTDKGQWLLDIAAFRNWQIDRHNKNGKKRHLSTKLTPQEVSKYNELRQKALELYRQLNQIAPDSNRVRIRFFRYLAGEPMDAIAKSEDPPVSRQAVQKSLRIAIKGVSIKQLRLIYIYGKWYGGHS